MYYHWHRGICTVGAIYLLRFPETVTAISFELQGVYDQAQESYEQAMKRARDLHNVGPAPFSIIPEYKLWEDHWCKYVTFFFLYFCLSFFSFHPYMCFIMLSSPFSLSSLVYRSPLLFSAILPLLYQIFSGVPGSWVNGTPSQSLARLMLVQTHS